MVARFHTWHDEVVGEQEIGELLPRINDTVRFRANSGKVYDAAVGSVVIDYTQTPASVSVLVKSQLLIEVR